MRFVWGVASDVGRARAVNQDNAVARDGLFAVADGMGGHRGGEVASQIAVNEISSHEPIVATNDLVAAIRKANESIMEAASADPSLEGMGTTLTAIALVYNDGEDRLAIANVGDSRVYALVNEGAELQQLTEDHSLVAQLVREGSLSAADAERHPQRNVLTRALGVDPNVAVDAWEITVSAGDRFILCSDGLYNEVSEDQIAAVLRRLADPAEAARELTDLANQGGGRDNITVLVVDVVNAGDGAPTSAHAAGTTVARPPVDDLAGFSTAPADSPSEADPSLTLIGTSPNGAAQVRALVPDDEHAPPVEIREPRPPLFTVRTAFFGFAVAVVALAAFFSVVWMKHHTFVVKFDEQGNVAIYRGKVLWYGEEFIEVRNPTLTEKTLAETDVVKVRAGHHTDSLPKARAYVDALEQNIKRIEAVTGSPTATTVPTTATAVTTTSTAPTPAPAPSSAGALSTR